LMKLLVSSVFDSGSAMAPDASSNTFCSFPRYYFNWLRKACQAAKVSINLSPKSVPFSLTIYILIFKKLTQHAYSRVNRPGFQSKPATLPDEIGHPWGKEGRWVTRMP